MSRYTESSCRVCRRTALKLFMKGERCFTDKCAFERRPYPPGQHGQRRKKMSEYGLQLREKQRAKNTYGVQERQFRKYFEMADNKKGVTGDNLMRFLESRLDNIVYRLGFARSRCEARQLVRHNHIKVNDKKVSIPSYQVKSNDLITMMDESRKLPAAIEGLEGVKRRGLPDWLTFDESKFMGQVLSLPSRDQITEEIQEQLIVELYSK